MRNLSDTMNRRDSKEWRNWKWQQQNAIRDVRELTRYFTNIDPSLWETLFRKSGERLKFQVTPYLLSQMSPQLHQDELEKNPFYLQFFPLGDIYTKGNDAYDGTDNWERPEEFPTSNLHHKYTNRALVRFRNCLGYCSFCFEALGTLEKSPSHDKLFDWGDWQKSLEYIQSRPEIEEVLLSGGEPMLMSDEKLRQVLQDLSDLKAEDGRPKVRFKRIHTRVLTFNPYRVTDEFAQITSDYRINEIAANVAHPSEVTQEFLDAVYKLRDIGGRHAPLLATHTPLLRGVNDSPDILWELFSKLYETNMKPYYLLHTMPHTPFADKQRISVRDGVRLMKKLKRHKSNIAVPEYVIVHYDGKQTVPLELSGTPEFQYTTDTSGNPIVRFRNWKGDWVEYPDTTDKLTDL